MTRNEASLQLEGIVQAAMDAIVTVDENQRIVQFNAAAARMFGVPEHVARGAPLDRFIPPHYRTSHRNQIKRFGETGVSTRHMGGRTVYGLRANGEEFPIEASISQITANGRKLYTAILRDVSERLEAEAALRRAHAELAALSHAANQALEEERRRIARELHDELGQMLTAMKIDIADMQSHLPPQDADLQQRCERLRALVDHTFAATRRMALDLRPLILDDLGLAAAVDWLVENVTHRTAMQIRVDFDDRLAQIGEPLASAIFRILQESLTNIVRHAEATEVSIQVRHADDHALLTVRDNGRGIDVPRKPDSLGLLGMRERARLLGGTLEVQALPEGGTLLSACLPCPALKDRT